MIDSTMVTVGSNKQVSTYEISLGTAMRVMMYCPTVTEAIDLIAEEGQPKSFAAGDGMFLAEGVWDKFASDLADFVLGETPPLKHSIVV